MKRVEPRVFLIGETRIIKDGLNGLGAYLEYIGAKEWTSDAPSDAEKIIEVMGRLCYRSFKPGLNPNVTKIREHNKEYLGNIVSVRHGSVTEHPMCNFIITDVSRVFTHELVRHRVGRNYDERDELRNVGLYEFIEIGPGTDDTAFSQESLRFVRFDNVGFWIPSVIAKNEEAARLFIEKLRIDEEYQLKLTRALGIDKMAKFEDKKKATSAIRRVVSMGVATNIGWSANPRTIRWVLEMRTHPSAEEEIRLVFGKVGEIVTKRYPHLFGDYEIEIVDELPWYKTKYQKV